ncbi:ABC transporter permease [Pseudomonadota bacterium]
MQRLLAVAYKESSEIVRDPVRLLAYLLVPAILMLIFGHGMNLDIDNIPFTTLDYDNSSQSREYIDSYIQSEYFDYQGPSYSDEEVYRKMVSGRSKFFLEIPAGFGRNLSSDRTPQVGAFIDGTIPFRGETARGYVVGTHFSYLQNYIREVSGKEIDIIPVDVESRYWYNKTFESKNTFVPGMIAMILTVFPGIIITLAISREKELGTIVNFYTTPLTRLEFLLGKQVVYLVISTVNLFILIFMAIYAFDLQIKGNFLLLTIGGIIYLVTATGVGMLFSAIAKTQIAGLLMTMILSMVPSFIYSGLMTPISSLEDSAIIMSNFYAVKHFTQLIIGSFTKDLSLSITMFNYVSMILFYIVVLSICLLLLKKQEK